jgi:hypothetical protein
MKTLISVCLFFLLTACNKQNITPSSTDYIKVIVTTKDTVNLGIANSAQIDGFEYYTKTKGTYEKTFNVVHPGVVIVQLGGQTPDSFDLKMYYNGNLVVSNPNFIYVQYKY